MLDGDSEHWVRMLLQSSKASEMGSDFAAAIEQLEVRRRQAADSVKEQSAFIAVLQARARPTSAVRARAISA